jgi:hypothetical protein
LATSDSPRWVASLLDKWLRRPLDRWHGSASVAELGVYLRDELNGSVPKAQRTHNPSGFHIGAFESRDGSAVPVLQYVSNVQSLDVQTGAYSGFVEYSSGEHFPQHPGGKGPCQNVAPSQMRSSLRDFERTQGIPVWFRNGQLAFSVRTWAALMLAIGDITTNLRRAGPLAGRSSQVGGAGRHTSTNQRTALCAAQHARRTGDRRSIPEDVHPLAVVDRLSTVSLSDRERQSFSSSVTKRSPSRVRL